MKSTQPKGRLRYIIEIFRTSEEVQAQPEIDIEHKPSRQDIKTINTPRRMQKGLRIGYNIKQKLALTKTKKDEPKIKQLSDDEILSKYPLIKIDRLPKRKYELRLVIWNGDNIPAMDIGGTSDV